ncbi:molybdopterin-guanine dinucleotide biosynthesis protein B [Halomonas sp. Bachu 37]|uniref:molybdopterin-guanine dinucleotide biosynthesis protein B n=1 Tax=Halomonas kashgarensis TaxID=3084920 RepID=UPI003216ADC9
MSTPATLRFEPEFPLLGIAAWSGTGKTTLLETLLPLLRLRGLCVAVIKHAHHEFDVDQPGKDSHRLRVAGASPMLVASRNRFALMMETPGQQEPDLAHLIHSLYSHEPDLILVEGFKNWPIPKLALYRESVGSDQLVNQNGWIRAVASNCLDELALADDVARLELDDISAIADWVAAWPAKWKQEISRGLTEDKPTR